MDNNDIQTDFKFIFTEPDISHVKVVGLTSESLEKRVTADKPEQRKVEIRKVSEGFVKAIESDGAKRVLGKFVKQNGEMDVQQWLEPYTTLCFGIDIPNFLIHFVENHLQLFQEDDLDIQEIKSKVGQKYSVLVLTISLLEFAEISDNDKLKSVLVDLKSWSNEKFQPILLLMNINGALIHRTPEDITITNITVTNSQEMKQTDQKKKIIQKYRFKKINYYFREGNMVFLSAIMSHPRVRFAFYSAIQRKNIVPVLKHAFKDPKHAGLMGEYMRALFDQTFCEQNSQVTGEQYGFIRDLDKVWESNDCYQLGQDEVHVPNGFKFDKQNTLMLESEEISVYKNFENALIVDRYQKEDVWPTEEEHIRDQFEILRQIKSDLFNILDQCDGNIQTFLQDKCLNFDSQKDEENDDAIQLSKYLQKAVKLEPIGYVQKEKVPKKQPTASEEQKNQENPEAVKSVTQEEEKEEK